MKTRQKHKNRVLCQCRCGKCGNQIARQRHLAGYSLCQPCVGAMRGQAEDEYTHGLRRQQGRVRTPSRAHTKAAARRLFVHLASFHGMDDAQTAVLSYAQLDERHMADHEQGAPGHETQIPFAPWAQTRRRMVA